MAQHSNHVADPAHGHAKAHASTSGHADSADAEDVRRDFRNAVNMSAAEISKWLESEESRGVGITHEGANESVGHQSGRRIVELLHTKAADLGELDIAHMRKVVGYVHRHLAQRPAGDVRETHWRYSLMNWGHDPVK